MNLTERQEQARAVLNGPAKHVLLDGGSRSGKTFLIVRNIVLRALKAKGSRHAILRFRFRHVRESIGMDTLPAVMSRCFPDVPYSINKADWVCTYPNGSEIWLGGLDDKERTEKILGKEYSTLYLNECSQIPLASRNLAVTRLAQKVMGEVGGKQELLKLKMYYDCNPPGKTHWVYRLFYEHKNPDTKQPLQDAWNYARLTLNPADNRENLPADYISELERLPERMRKRFLLGQYGDAVAGALWTDEMIDRYRAVEGEMPQMLRVVVAVDPSGSGDEDNAHNDEIGIVVAGIGQDGNGYLLEDLSCKAGPKVWGNIATTAYDRHGANLIVGETNYGGAMVEFVVRAAKPNVPYRKLTASKGKSVRAEPIASLTEQGKVRFAGRFPELEDELCDFTTAGYVGTGSPNRADACVWAFSELFPGIARHAVKDKPLPIPMTGIV